MNGLIAAGSGLTEGLRPRADPTGVCLWTTDGFGNRRWPVEGGEMDLIAIYIFLWFGLFPKSFGRHLGIILAAARPTASTSQEQEP